MKRHKMTALWILLLAVFRLTADEIGLKDARVTFRVVDDVGNPVDGVHINASDLWSAKGYQGLTDTNGSFTCYWRKIYSPIGGVFSKKGYYITQGNVWSWTQWGEVPTNTLTVTLKRIINPVPMVKREVRLLFPILEEPVGFDFEKGDWVEPHGAGETADVCISGQKVSGYPDNLDFRASMVTSNDLNGFIAFPMRRRVNGDIVRSLFQPPQIASDAGYTNVLTAYRRYRRGKPLESNAILDNDYLFRLRCMTNIAGEITSAHVGWFYKSIELTGFKAYERETGRLRSARDDLEEVRRSRMWITFAYYYNPDPLSRSLEPREITDRQ